jgi:AcrR family transcriptional regulator
MASDSNIRRPARDAAATRRRILEAATPEFSAFGLAGGRTARIAEAADANQRMIYAYFGSKDRLFDAVLVHNILIVQEAVAFDVGDLPGDAQHVLPGAVRTLTSVG